MTLKLWGVLIVVLPIAAGCTPVAGNCTGWKPIPLEPESDEYLQDNDARASDGVTEHNVFGVRQGCWSSDLKLSRS